MEYNSQKDVLIIPEYGRNVQELIRHTLTIEDKDERQAYIETVINLMQQMHPQSRNVADSKIKLWQHAIRIAEADLEVDYPDGLSPKISPKRPDAIHYPEEIKRYRHYGKNVRTMIAKAVKMEDGPVKEGFVRTIASYMKMAYYNWHREISVSDDVIKGDLKAISKGKLTISEDESIDPNSASSNQTSRNTSKKKSSSYSNKSSRHKKRNHSSNYRNKNRRRK